MESFRHNGILVLQPPEPQGLVISIRGIETNLNELQEEMAIAWARKQGTPYVEDSIFVENFMMDFSRALGLNRSLSLEDVDFSNANEIVESERAIKEAMTKEEKKSAREARKAERELLKEHYGFAEVDRLRMELGNYQTEPSGIFMGRGEHPLRGRWKKGVTKKDITLNLSPSAPRPDGDWGEIVWAPDTMWIAKWTDELTNKVKYLWLHDSTPIKQEREAAKFDKALKLDKKTDIIREHILSGIHSDSPKRRMVAAACYLIENLSLRVGDEKDPDEADTVGATTLRAEHISFRKNVMVFKFLGKDSVAWNKEIKLPEDVYEVFVELYDQAVERIKSFQNQRKRSKEIPKKVAQIFPSVRSTHVNRFLSEAVPGLTAKVFRTYHATMIIREELKARKVKRADPDFIKKEAVKRANLEVARVMNHTKQAPKGWERTAERYGERIKKAEPRIEKAKQQLAEKRKRLKVRKKKEKATLTRLQESIAKQKVVVEKNKNSVSTWRDKRNRAKTAWDNARERKRRTRGSRRKGKTTKKERLEEAQESIERLRVRLDRFDTSLSNARERHKKSKEQLEKKQRSLADWKKKSDERIGRSQKTVKTANERVKKAELAKRKIEIDYSLAKSCRTWNLGTSLKSYIHPGVIHRWCNRVDFDWKKVYSKTLQRKFSSFFPE
ncbi:MAG: hypothetical protein ACXABC_06500 [Candidatus Thorarchaeota archaeon]|jgi:DNA topoisomerase-1